MGAPQGTPDRNTKPNRSQNILGTYREYGPYLTLGFQLAAAVVVFVALGLWLDAKAGTSPLFTLLGLAIGCTGGFIKFFRTISALERKRSGTKDSEA